MIYTNQDGKIIAQSRWGGSTSSLASAGTCLIAPATSVDRAF